MTTPTTTPPAATPSPAGKSINFKFLVIALVVLGLGAGLVVLEHQMKLRRDRQTIAWAEQAMKDGRYEDAAAQFARAVARHPADPDLSLKSGDAYYALSASQPEALQKARVAWEAAARLRPNDLPALQRLLHFHADWAEVHPTATAFRALGDAAKQVASVSPSDPEAATEKTIAQLGPWLSQDLSGATDATAHDALIASLGDSMRQDPADPRVTLYYALASARRAVELHATGQDAPARQVLERAEQAIEAHAGEKSDSNALSLYRAAEGLTVLVDASGRLAEPVIAPAAAHRVASTQPATTQPSTQPAAAPTLVLWPTWDAIDGQVRWGIAQPPHSGSTTRPAGDATAGLKAARALAARASGAMAPSDPRFVEVRLLEAQLAQLSGDAPAAERIRRDTLAARPGSLRAQVALASSVLASHPDQALAILDQTEKPDDAGPGPLALTRRELQVRAAQDKARLYLDAADNVVDDPVARQANVQKANAACETLAAMLVNDAASLKLTARLRMLQGRYADAVRLLDSALRAPGGRSDLELLSLHGAALVAVHEPQRALRSLHAVLAADPSREADRLLLAQTLIDEGRLAEAAQQVRALDQKLGADDPRSLAVRVRFFAAVIALEGDDATARQLHDSYAKLPESDLKQKVAKAELALVAGEPSDAVRLLRPERPEGSAAITVAADLARALIATGKPDEASAVLGDALRQHAGEPTLVAVQKSIDGPASPEAYEATLNDSGAKDFLKAVRLCRSALDAHEWPKAKEQLDAIAQLRAEDPLLFDLKFRYDLATEQWGDAGVCADRLARANFDRVEGRTYAFRLDAARDHSIAAADVARQMTMRYGQFVDGWIDLGRALQGAGRLDRAADNFNKALSLDPKNVIAVRSLAACLMSAGRGAEADKWIATGRQLAPENPELRELELDRQLAQNDPGQMVTARKAAWSKEPRPDTAVALARAELQLARTESVSNSPDAQAQLKAAVSLLKDAVGRWPDDKDCAFWAAHANAISGNVPEGKQILRQLCDRSAWASRPDGEQMLADFCLVWGDPQSAAVALRDALSRGATGPTIARQRAEVLMRQGAWRAALDALKPYPTDPMAALQRFMIVIGSGSRAAAQKEIETEQAADPTDPRLMTVLGMLYATSGDNARARQWLDRAFAAGDDALAARARGEIALRGPLTAAGLATALQDLAIANEANPGDPGAALLLSDAYLRAGDLGHARLVRQAGVEVMPNNTTLRQALLALDRESASLDWERVRAIIDAGRRLAPSDLEWDVAEARMWQARQDWNKAAASMRQAVRLAQIGAEAADTTMRAPFAARVRTLLPDEFWLLLTAQANQAALDEANDAITRYGARDMLAAWAHYARGAVNRRVGREEIASDEYITALSIAQAAGGYGAAAAIVERISTESGPDEAVRRINAYIAAVDQGRVERVGYPHDPRWDLLRVDLLRRNNEWHAAAEELDKLLPKASSQPDAIHNELLRMAVSIYAQDVPVPQYQKARDACAELLKRLPDDVWALNNMAAFCLASGAPGDAAKALEYAQRAYQAVTKNGPAGPQIADTYGWALARAGRAREAIDLLKPAAAQLNIPDVQYHLGEAYLAAGDARDAWPRLTAALRQADREARQGAHVDPQLRRGIADACWRVLRADAAEMFKAGHGAPGGADAVSATSGAR